jgi:DNA-binding response OmpR family regulator
VIPLLPGLKRELPLPLVLLADEDARILELLAFAFKGNHFRVSVTQDGDEALRRAQSEHPDLVIADVRLPRRGGLELCDLLRRDPENGDVPILLLSTANDTESRVEALAHGADGFMSKPFSPKELVARAQRLVSRARDAARHAQRSAELERDLGKMRGEARCAREEAERERELRSLAGGMMGELLRTLDLDELDARLLRETCRQTGARSAALLFADGTGVLSAVAARGDLFERWAGLSLPAAGACVEWLFAVGRPVRRDELDRLPEPGREVAELAAHGVALLAALRGTDGALEALIVCEDRGDGETFTALDRDRLATLCATAAPARATARRFREQQDRALAMLGATACSDPRHREVACESHGRLVPAAHAVGMTPSDRELLERALDLGPWAWTEAGRAALDSLAAGDPTRRLRLLHQLLGDAEACANGEPRGGEEVLVLLTAAGLRYQALRLAGRSTYEAWRTAVSWIGLHTDPLFRGNFPEAIEPAR